MEDLEGAHSHETPMTRAAGVVLGIRSESMQITNDPRFFTDNVINYRLAAFGSLSVVSGLLLGCAMADIMDMDKNMNLKCWPGVIQAVSFAMLLWIFVVNVVSTYVGVAQPYHTIRLTTSGPTGLEAATSYYLNPTISTYRHFAIKYMLMSLPFYIIQMGLRLMVKFDRGNKNVYDPDSADAPLYARIEGYVFGGLMIVCGICLYCLHRTHYAIFNERYNLMISPPALSSHVSQLANPSLQTQVKPNYLVSEYY